jgi:hypothetical protein
MVRILIALVLLGHGIGHSMGIMQVLRVATVNPAWNGDSWLLTNTVGSTATRAFGITVWIAAMIGFVIAAGIVMGWLPQAWWLPVALGSSVVSLAGLAVFPMAFPLFSTIGAFLVNVAVIAAVMWVHWVPSDLAT